MAPIDVTQETAILRFVEHKYADHKKSIEEGNKSKLSCDSDSVNFPFWNLTLDENPPPPHERIFDAAQKDPVRGALIFLAREVGWKLYSMGGVDLMREIFDNQNEPFRTYLDHWWDNVGLFNDCRGIWHA